MSSQTFEYLSFDCYGTLIDWENGILNALRELFGGFVEINQADVLRSFAKWEADVEAGPFLCYRDVLIQVQKGMCQDFAITAEHPDLLAESVGRWEPFGDTIAGLNQLAKPFKLVVLSNVDADMFAQTQARLDVQFSQVCVAEEIGSYKPSRQNFEYMFEQLGCKREQVLHVAQSLFHDHVPAKEMGMTTVWVNRQSIVKGQGATPPANAVPDYEVADVAGLVGLLTP